MSNTFYDRWADVMVDYCTSVRADDKVAILGGVAAEPLLRAIHRAALRKGAEVHLLPSLSESLADTLNNASEAQLAHVSELERWRHEVATVTITVMASTNTRAQTSVDPARQTIYSRARAELKDISMRRAAAGDVRWSLTIFPTAAYAQDADMATDEFAAFLAGAMYLDQPDPVAAWQELSARQQTLIDWLSSRSELHITGPDTDLRMNVGSRKWINSDGKRNFPSGEVFTGPHEDSAEGHVRFAFPVVTDGREISDIRLRFERGMVVDASASKNERYLIDTLDTDPGARRLGEIAFGTNFGITRFTRNILLDEKIGGTMHMALGAGYPETGNSNKSGIHWDMICDLRAGGQATLDGEVILQDGAYRV
ncbi:MAG: aminopeptidase [Thermomicrobiales bacterium]